MRFALSAMLMLFASTLVLGQNTREKKVREDKVKVEAEGFWLYNDLPKAYAEAKKANKPIIVVLRCLPCEECVKLDDELVDKNPTLRPLLEKFVRVRIVSTNGLDLTTFQYDTDQSFAVFLLNADGTIYGRFGTRSHRTNWVGDVSIEGLAKALQGALDLHQQFPTVKASLATKKGPTPDFPVPEKYPALGKYGPQLDYAGNVVQSCIHCHQIGDAARTFYRKKSAPIPEELLFPYPHPKSVGLILDPKERGKILSVETDSFASKSGFQSGDEIVSLAGQPILSIADVQWVLHRTDANGAKIISQVNRLGKSVSISLNLPPNWRQGDDISWRASTWGYRRMALGGLLLETPSERPTGITSESMALRIKHVGQFGPHAAAKNAGFQVGDVIVSFDGKSDLKRETDVLAYSLRNKKIGEQVPVQVFRSGKVITLKLPMQE